MESSNCRLSSSTQSRSRSLESILFLLAVVGATAAAAQEPTPKFQLNGYLTQAYGITDGVPILGLDEDGTFDYRSAALLFRFGFSANDDLVVQLSHEKLGSSPVNALREEVELDWAFYRHRFSSGTELRVGRIPIPFGVYNEIRDVGTFLEFYRPPVGIYFEGAFSSETVDGVDVSHSFSFGKGWTLDLDGYWGSWDRAEFIAPDFVDGRAEDAFGVQLWLNTPQSTLRFGFAAQRFEQTGGIVFLREDGSEIFDTFLFSIDTDFPRLILRAEAQVIKTAFVFAPDVEIPAYYVLAGYRINDHLAFHLIYEDSWSKASGGPFPPLKIDPFYEDLAASMIYRFTPQTLVRLELHHSETTQADIPLPLSGEPYKVDYGILSFSASF